MVKEGIWVHDENLTGGTSSGFQLHNGPLFHQVLQAQSWNLTSPRAEASRGHRRALSQTQNPELLCCGDTVPTLWSSPLDWILSLFCLVNSFKMLIFVGILFVLTYHQLPVTSVNVGFVQVCWAFFLHHNYNMAHLKSCHATYWFMMYCSKLYRFNVMIPVFFPSFIQFFHYLRNISGKMNKGEEARTVCWLNQQPSVWLPLWISALAHMNEQITSPRSDLLHSHAFRTALACWWQTPA